MDAPCLCSVQVEERLQRALEPFTSAELGYRENVTEHEPGYRLSQNTQSTSTVKLQFPASVIVRKTFAIYKLLRDSILLQQPRWDTRIIEAKLVMHLLPS